MIQQETDNVTIGMGGWELPPFNQYFYPRRPKKDFRKLEFYSRYFDSIEVNSTFYNTRLSSQHSRRWLEDVSANKNFMFTVKVYRGFTHTFDATNDDVKSVRRLIEPLAEAGRLGGLVMQFPHSFLNTPEHQNYIRQFSRVFYPHRLFVEVRHASWNNRSFFDFLRGNKIHLINVDMPELNQYMPFTAEAWGGVAYFRMMGRNAATWSHPELGERYDYYYEQAELEELMQKIELLKRESNSVFVVFHNDPGANSLVNGFQLRHLLHHKPRLLVPEGLVYAFPKLKEISGSVNIDLPLFAEVTS